MSENILLAVKVGVANGPTLTITQTIAIDAYDKIDVAVPDGTSDLDVELQPNATDKVRFVLVSSDLYDENLTYKVNDGTDERILDGPYLLSGTGAVALLDAAPAKLVVSNSSGKTANVRVLIGRKVT